MIKPQQEEGQKAGKYTDTLFQLPTLRTGNTESGCTKMQASAILGNTTANYSVDCRNIISTEVELDF